MNPWEVKEHVQGYAMYLWESWEEIQMYFVYISAYNLTHAMNPGQDQMDAPETSGMRR